MKVMVRPFFIFLLILPYCILGNDGFETTVTKKINASAFNETKDSYCKDRIDLDE